MDPITRSDYSESMNWRKVAIGVLQEQAGTYNEVGVWI